MKISPRTMRGAATGAVVAGALIAVMLFSSIAVAAAAPAPAPATGFTMTGPHPADIRAIPDFPASPVIAPTRWGYGGWGHGGWGHYRGWHGWHGWGHGGGFWRSGRWWNWWW